MYTTYTSALKPTPATPYVLLRTYMYVRQLSYSSELLSVRLNCDSSLWIVYGKYSMAGGHGRGSNQSNSVFERENAYLLAALVIDLLRFE